jgi:hypothetical protein
VSKEVHDKVYTGVIHVIPHVKNCVVKTLQAIIPYWNLKGRESKLGSERSKINLDKFDI